jgi:hypothetical protein
LKRPGLKGHHRTAQHEMLGDVMVRTVPHAESVQPDQHSTDTPIDFVPASLRRLLHPWQGAGRLCWFPSPGCYGLSGLRPSSLASQRWQTAACSRWTAAVAARQASRTPAQIPPAQIPPAQIPPAHQSPAAAHTRDKEPSAPSVHPAPKKPAHTGSQHT